jgi:hypothetical protein
VMEDGWKSVWKGKRVWETGQKGAWANAPPDSDVSVLPDRSAVPYYHTVLPYSTLIPYYRATKGTEYDRFQEEADATDGCAGENKLENRETLSWILSDEVARARHLGVRLDLNEGYVVDEHRCEQRNGGGGYRQYLQEFDGVRLDERNVDGDVSTRTESQKCLQDSDHGSPVSQSVIQ